MMEQARASDRSSLSEDDCKRNKILGLVAKEKAKLLMSRADQQLMERVEVVDKNKRSSLSEGGFKRNKMLELVAQEKANLLMSRANQLMERVEVLDKNMRWKSIERGNRRGSSASSRTQDAPKTPPHKQ
jgi:hypothetical protein